MEMTISRDRWQLHLKTRGQHFHDLAHESERLHLRHPDIGADNAALALHALAEVMERCRAARLTRFQHVLLRLGELISYAETSACLARRAARAKEGKLHDKASDRFNAEALPVVSRIFAREAAQKVATDGIRLVVGAGGVSENEVANFETSLGLPAIYRAQAGLTADMDFIADTLYGRAGKHAEATAVALQR
jgi:alkylation response protein AidB-like acyl-CoA dehydrogenase